MTFLADLHIHSRFSLATSSELSPSHLDAWARLKGIDVLATGDFTHPAWRAELCDQLVKDPESGLYKLKGPSQTLPFLPKNYTCASKAPLFIPEVEISSIYKKKGRVRKIHNLIFVPDFEDAERFSKRLEKFGNISSDGRPILGLDAHDILELLLETVPDGVLIPAHIWTPWFSLFGSKSGFDDIRDCFEDLTDYIFALETGLSSDPLMNRYLSALDNYVLISNSDAHSGVKLGREVNVFEGRPGYKEIFNALKASARREKDQDKLHCRFTGTLEFFPEEGKYHLDGHRACQVSFDPVEAQKHSFVCPVCHKPMTVGVLHRVMELADRVSPASPPFEPSFKSIMPLLEMTSEIMGVSVQSKKVLSQYAHIVTHLGPELEVLCNIDAATVSGYWDLLGEAVHRLRSGRVILEGGYDGAFGRVRLFEEKELGLKIHSKITSTKAIGSLAKTDSVSRASLSKITDFQQELQQTGETNTENSKAKGYSEAQKNAMTHGEGAALVLAGPGAGKTHLLTGRILQLLEKGMDGGKILVLTFTRKAAEEIRKRVAFLCSKPHLPRCDTLHAVCFSLLCEHDPSASLLTEDSALRLFLSANPKLSARSGKAIWSEITRLRELCQLQTADKELSGLFTSYLNFKEEKLSHPSFDFTELLEWAVKNLSKQSKRYESVLVDEVQDLSPLNLKVIAELCSQQGHGFFGIGDPDQSIYAFRGACPEVEKALRSFWPDLTVYHLSESFRASPLILNAAEKLLKKPQCGLLTAARNLPAELRFFRLPDEKAEARLIVKCISELIGSNSHTISDGKTTTTPFADSLAPRDIAILVRFRQLLPPISRMLSSHGIPISCPSEESFWTDPVMSIFLSYLDPALPDKNFPFSKDKLPEPTYLTEWLDQQEWSGFTASKSPAFLKLCSFWKECGSWSRFFEELTWLEKEMNYRMRSDTVSLLTLHAAKGLEFRAIFMPACEEGILPYKKTEAQRFYGNGLKDGEGEMEREERNKKELEAEREEEKRLCYVGLTRASELLYLSCAESRLIYGKRYKLAPSTFLKDLEPCFQKSRIQRTQKMVRKQGSLF